ncbi:MAG: hypothetical protein HUJ91_01660 [Bacteroidales bacterium]|nr:hypothetical protein [Bacteroidales bacterium]
MEDKGNYDLEEINELTIEGIEDSYSLFSLTETLDVTPDLQPSVKGYSEDNYEFNWFVCEGALTTDGHKHTTISTERNLHYPVNLNPGNYSIYFQVTDKNTGVKFEKSLTLTAMSPLVRGFYILGNKEDGIAGLDFLSMPTGRDTSLIPNLFVNKNGIKGAKNLVFTGYYAVGNNTALWLITEDNQYTLDFSSTKTEVDVLPKNLDNILFPTMEGVQKPFHLANVLPAPYGPNCTALCGSNRILLTDGEAYCASIISGEAYGQPVTRDASTVTANIFTPYKVAFYAGNSTYVSTFFFYDTTNNCFKVPTGGYSSYACTFCKKPTDSATPFYWDQTNYTPVRTIVYGENGYGNAGRSYALMTDGQNYYVYGFKAQTSATGMPTKATASTIDPNDAIDIAKASHYAFFSMQQIILYSVGSKLYAYDYARKDCKMINDFGEEITYLAFDFHSASRPTDLLVATYSPAQKGTLCKYTVTDDINNINVEARVDDVWHTDLRIEKVFWRYCTN